MWLYYLLKTISTLVSWLPYKLVVNIGIGIGHLYHKIAKKTEAPCGSNHQGTAWLF